MDFVKKFINEPLLSHPMNWVIVWLVATIWLLAFHVIMKGFSSMQSGAFQNGPLPNGNALPPSQTYANSNSAQSFYQGIPNVSY